MPEDTSYGEADVDPVHQSIATALSYGYRPDEILESLKSSKDPSHQEWYKKYSENNKDEEATSSPVTEVAPVQKPVEATPLLKKFHEMTPSELGLGALGVAGLGAVGIGGGQIAKNAVSRWFPSVSEIEYAKQNKIQEEKLKRGKGVISEEQLAHEAKLRENELAIQQEKLNQEKLRTQKLQTNIGVKPSEQEISPVVPEKSNSNLELPVSNEKITTTPNPDPIEIVKSTLGTPPPANAVAPQAPPVAPAPLVAQPQAPSITPAQQVIQNDTGTAPVPPVSNQSPTGQTTPNPVQSGEGASPLHEAGVDVGKTPLQATTESTNESEVKRGGESGKPRNNPTKEQRLNTYAEENKIARELHGQPTITTSDKPHEVLAETAKTPQMKEFYRQQYEGNDKLKKGVSEAYKTGRLNEGDIFIPNAGGGTAHFLNMNYNKGEDDVLKDYKAFRDTYYKGRPDIHYDAEYQKNLKEFNAKRNPASTIPGLETMTGEQVGKANPEETNFFGSKHLRKATIAGTTGIILTATQMAQATEEANKGNYAPATYAGGEAVAGGLLSKLFGLGAKAGGAGLSAATYTPELNANEGKELAQRRYAYEMSKKNGAGRGQLNTSK